MRMLFIAAAVIATGMIAVATVSFNQKDEEPVSDLMLPDATQTKEEILRRIPIDSSILIAKEIMNSNGFMCGVMKNTSYADFANPSNKQMSRGPADILYCDSGAKSSGFMFTTKRWQVSFEDSEGKVSYIAVGVGLTGP